MAAIALWLFVVLVGIDLGAGIYESRVVVPLWSSDVPRTLEAGNPYGQVAINAGMRFWAYVTSAVALAAALAFIFGLGAPAPQRTWQIAAAAVELVAVASTLLYFRPTLVRLFMGHGAGLSQSAIQTTVRQWVLLSRVRVGVTCVAWGLAFYALTLR